MKKNRIGGVWSRAGRIAVAVGAIAACGSPHSDAPPAPSEAPPPLPTSVAPEPAPAPAPRVVRQEHRVATFVADELDECVEWTRVYTIPPELPDWVPPPLEVPTDSPGAEVVVIHRPCDEQFAGRTNLATCGLVQRGAADSEPRVQTLVGLVQQNYRYATALDDDRRMRECMELGGDWGAVAEDSPEYRHARLEFHAHSLQRAGEQLQRAGRRR
jgi:hypothetical protein